MTQPSENPNPFIETSSGTPSPNAEPGGPSTSGYTAPGGYGSSTPPQQPTYPPASSYPTSSGFNVRGMSGQALSGQDERNWAVGAHLSAFVAAWFALGFLGPLTVMLIAGQRSAFVRRHAVEALNFNLSILIYVVISVILAFVIIGIPMLVAIGVIYLVAVILAAMAASRGEEYRYPLTIRFVK